MVTEHIAKPKDKKKTTQASAPKDEVRPDKVKRHWREAIMQQLPIITQTAGGKKYMPPLEFIQNGKHYTTDFKIVVQMHAPGEADTPGTWPDMMKAFNWDEIKKKDRIFTLPVKKYKGTEFSIDRMLVLLGGRLYSQLEINAIGAISRGGISYAAMAGKTDKARPIIIKFPAGLAALLPYRQDAEEGFVQADCRDLFAGSAADPAYFV